MPSNNPSKSAQTPVSRGRQWVGVLGLIAILMLIVGLFRLFPSAEYIDNEAINRLVIHYGWLGVTGFYLVGALITAVGFPRQLVAFISGFIFGNALGSVLAIAAAISGCYLCFIASRQFLQSLVRRLYAPTVDMLNRFIENDAFLKIVILRLQPFGTNLITNLSAGVSRIPARVFISSSLLGYIPQTVVFALIGSGIRVNSSTQMMVSAGLFALSIMIGLYLYWKRPIN